jgi:CRP/FNR family cyclic AMP-dependent transcriptional regulator
VLSADTLRTFLRNYPEFAEFLVQKLIARVRHVTEQLRDLAMKNVYERATSLLSELAVDDGHGRTIDKSITQQEIANRIGATREMVNHIIRDLVRGGFMLRDGERGMVLLKDLPKHW